MALIMPDSVGNKQYSILITSALDGILNYLKSIIHGSIILLLAIAISNGMTESMAFIFGMSPIRNHVEEEQHIGVVYTILISSGLKSGQLKVHCKSFGTIFIEHVEHVLEPGKSFGWDFQVSNSWHSYDNYYSCNFDWNGKKVDLDVWDGGQRGTCVESKTHWAVLEDGFYFRCVGGEGNWEKRFTWEGGIHLGPSVDNAH
ncbi:hypothetical protein Cgig2_007911 [Carnegiea gigantea]|uniref:S-protein homolog n=1 Tax=Carnegiea gigantea TaxID=171969 RepID=A0A9Q1GTA6_9CARY|nr:hypothetical protein Cgig2_013350 [Carnegiea gigantea]KAJ8424204.1 hypothetical protein Cgig2_013354 [Carnegiea gigantea]KAJ8424208.1 hypothetical protein Cgig2_013358 [Carnegiea gigantea]KAJ8442073.1 hypothetical protein Cgig2_007911 [Carnegiea gigantea]